MKDSRKLQQIARIVIPILRKNGVVRAGIFGSYATGKQKKNSDIDILVKIGKRMSLFDFVGIKLELEERLKKRVDLVEYETIKPLLKEAILSEEVRVL